jgi:hypothetical protein
VEDWGRTVENGRKNYKTNKKKEFIKINNLTSTGTVEYVMEYKIDVN